jgi:Bacterial Ig-like domain
MNTRLATLTFVHKRTTPRKRLFLFSLPLLMALLTACPEPSTPTPPASTKPTITSFTATPPSLPAGGGSLTLIWDVKDATTLRIDGGVGTVTGTSKAVSIMSTTTFTLTATNAAGSSTQTTSVRVEAEADTTPPTVLSVDPPNGATGVNDDASVIVTFSERMDKAATEFSYESLELPTEGVTFSWNTDGTVLTIKPNDLLDYAAGDDPSITAKTYAINFSIATDISGNSLSAEFNSSFSTLRVISSAIYGTATLDGSIVSDGVVNSDATEIAVGKTEDSKRIRGFFSFDLTGIPAGVVTDEAKVIINKVGVAGADFYQFTSVTLDHLNYGNALGSAAYGQPSLRDLGIVDSGSSPASGYLSSDVTVAVNDDLTNRAARGNRSQYRLRLLNEPTDADPFGFVSFTSSEGPNGQRPFLNVVYYLP